MPSDKDIKCCRCWRDSYKVPIGLVALIYPNDEKRQSVPVCVPHMKEIAKYLQLSTGKGNVIKLKKLINDGKQMNLYEPFVSET